MVMRRNDVVKSKISPWYSTLRVPQIVSASPWKIRSTMSIRSL